MIDTIEAAVVVGSAGLLSARPAAGKGRAFYYATDVGSTGTIYYDTGSGWRDVSSVGGVATSGVLIGGASSEGSSLSSARADHVHAIPLVTTGANGAMIAADKVKLDGATSAATASKIAMRDASGRLQVASPSATADAAPKSYVDAQTALRALTTHTHTWAQITGTPATYPATAHTHPWAQITGAPATYAPSAHSHAAADTTSGIFAPARIPDVTTLANGAMLSTDKVKLDAATASNVSDALVMRNASGVFSMGEPLADTNGATKGYVDGQVGTRALTSHAHSWAQITSKPSTFAPSAHGHAWADITGAPATYAPSDHNHSTADVTSGVFSAARIPLATTSVHGAMSAMDRILLNGATNAPTANTLVKNDSAGRFQVTSPALAADAANKGYVDAQVDTAAPAVHSHTWASITSKPSTFAPSSHDHAWADITGKPTTFAPASHNHDASDTISGVFAPARIPVVTTTAQGAMSTTDKIKLDGATSGSLNAAGLLVQRDSNGLFGVVTPTSGTHPTTKAYVDAEIDTRAASSHSHSWASITSKPGSFPPESHQHSAIVNGNEGLYVDSAGRVWGSALWDRVYSSLPNMYLTSEGTIGRATRTPADSNHNHPASDITSGTLAYARIRGTDEVHARTATNRSVWVDADGRFGQNTSSIRFKENVRDAELDPAAILRLRPRIYDRKNREEGVNEFGLIAEEVEAEVPTLALYDRDGVLETVAYEKLAVAQQVVLQDLDRRLKEAGL